MVWSGDAAFGRKLAEIVLVLLLVERRCSQNCRPHLTKYDLFHSFIVCFGFKLLRKSNTWDSHQSNQNKPILEKYFQTFPLHGEFEWRREYRWAVRSAAPLTVLVSSLLGWSSPVTSKLGWSRRSSDPTTDCWGCTTTWRTRWRAGQWGEESSPAPHSTLLCRLLPTFMFGLTADLLHQMYGGPHNIPTRGLITSSTGLSSQ